MNQAVTACVIIIGNEILSGRTQDINLNHIASTLGGWGIQVHHARVIPDDEDIIVNTINEVRKAYNYVFTTGGIGPTHDDITAVCVAKAFGVPIIQHPDIAERIRQRPAPDDIMASRLLMARVPEGAGLIDNPSGGPQGFAMENVYVRAGIPRVMQAMLSTLEGKLEQAKDLQRQLKELQRTHTAAMPGMKSTSEYEEDLNKLNDVSRLPLIYPYWHQNNFALSRFGHADKALHDCYPDRHYGGDDPLI